LKERTGDKEIGGAKTDPSLPGPSPSEFRYVLKPKDKQSGDTLSFNGRLN